MYEWECPECELVQPLPADRAAEKVWVGPIQCAECKRTWNLGNLYRHGFVFES